MTNPADVKVAVVGAGGKMGTRVSNNFAKSDYQASYVETSPAAAERVKDAGRELTDLETAVSGADVIVLAVPDIALGPVTETIAPMLQQGSIVITLDPAAAYAGLLKTIDGVAYLCAHPCHPSVFLERTSPEQWADTFGGQAAPQEVVAARQSGTDAQQALGDEVIRCMYGPVIDVHWVTVKQLAQLEPTLVETVGCMVGQFLKDVMDHAINEVGIPEPAVKAIFYGHVYIALTNALRGSNPFSDACLLAMDYGREAVIKDDWARIWDDEDLDRVLAKMLRLEMIER